MRLISMGFAGVIACAAPAFAIGANPGDAPEAVAPVAPVAVQRVSVPTAGIRDEVAMVLVGTVLIGLAGAVRRAA